MMVLFIKGSRNGTVHMIDPVCSGKSHLHLCLLSSPPLHPMKYFMDANAARNLSILAIVYLDLFPTITIG